MLSLAATQWFLQHVRLLSCRLSHIRFCELSLHPIQCHRDLVLTAFRKPRHERGVSHRETMVYSSEFKVHLVALCAAWSPCNEHSVVPLRLRPTVLQSLGCLLGDREAGNDQFQSFYRNVSPSARQESSPPGSWTKPSLVPYVCFPKIPCTSPLGRVAPKCHRRKRVYLVQSPPFP